MTLLNSSYELLTTDFFLFCLKVRNAKKKKSEECNTNDSLSYKLNS